MSSKPSSRWADTAEDAALDAKRKREKDEKKRLKVEKARKLEEERRAKEAAEQKTVGEQEKAAAAESDDSDRPAKRRKLTPARYESRSGGSPDESGSSSSQVKLLRFESPACAPCRDIQNFDKLNDIEQGTYGYVSRAKEVTTGKIVALKRLKIEPGDQQGFPVTALREIRILENCNHRNIVGLQEVVTGQDASKMPV
jgi:cell division cycle 2-like